MEITTLVVGTQRYPFDADAEALKKDVVGALRAGGGFVTVIAPGSGHRTDLLITNTISARIEFSEQEPTAAGADGPAPLVFDEYDDYGL